MDKPVHNPVENIIIRTIETAFPFKNKGGFQRGNARTHSENTNTPPYGTVYFFPHSLKKVFSKNREAVEYKTRFKFKLVPRLSGYIQSIHPFTNFQICTNGDNLCITLFYLPRGVEYTTHKYMEQLYITKLVRVGTSTAVVVPKHILKLNNWERGDYIVFTFAGFESLILKRLNDREVRRIKDAESTIDFTK